MKDAPLSLFSAKAIAAALLLASLSMSPVLAQSGDLGYFLPAKGGPIAISRFAADAAYPAAAAPDATASATALPPATTALPPATARLPTAATFLGFPDKIAFHRFSGWAAGGTLLAAGIVGGIHFLGMMDEAHAYRDSLGIDEFDSTLCPPKVETVWGGSVQQALRWTHVGFLGLGELFYAANAVTGTSLIGPLPPGWTKSRIHRYAFFGHATLMVSEAILGIFMSDALKRGDHETMRALGAAHVAIGIAIPTVILGAGAIMDR